MFSLQGLVCPGRATHPAALILWWCPSVWLCAEWWEGEYVIPTEAVALNFVVNYFDHWDNNGRKDYKVGGMGSTRLSPPPLAAAPAHRIHHNCLWARCSCPLL